MDALDTIYSKNCNFSIARFEVQVFGEELKTSLRGLFVFRFDASTGEMVFRSSARS
jgi:hypothetical protein